MSELRVEVRKIDEVFPHPNADRLEIAKLAGWNCVVRKDEYKPGQKVVYFPIDSVLPGTLEARLFPADSKIKLEKSRIRTIKIRGAISQGLVVTPSEVGVGEDVLVGTDVTNVLGVTKYEPPARNTPGLLRGKMKAPKYGNPAFRKYTDIENFKYHPELFAEGEQVVVTEKLHGTSARYGWLPNTPRSLWDRVKKLFGMFPPYEFCVGSRNVQLQGRDYKGFYNKDVYSKIAAFYEIDACLNPGECVYGEIVGDGIQKGYTYGCGLGEHEFYVYDVMVDGRWLDHDELAEWCEERGFDMVPVLYRGPYSRALVDHLRSGDSVLGGQKVREGVVVRSATETMTYMGRKVVKYINDEYLLGDQTDFH